METLVVVTQPKDWPLDVPGVRVVPARSYLLDEAYSSLKRAKVFNLCRQYRYQALGYYVSLLAEARGHKPIPSVMTMQDLRTPAVVHLAADELVDKIQHSLASIQSERFVLSIYFGHNTARRHDAMATALFKLFPAPFLRASFTRGERWELQSIAAIPTSGIPEAHLPFARDAARSFFAGHTPRRARPSPTRYDLAILFDPADPTGPSDPKAIERFVRAGEELALATEIIGREDYGRLAEFDGLFIRTTTAVNHYTYRFSRRAAAEGLVVIDDPTSILRCTNKVYLAELLSRSRIPTPRTRTIQRDNLAEVATTIGFPCILKRPDSSSSLGVMKIEDEAALHRESRRLFDASDLLIVQEFMPTPFDWRIAILDGRPLFAAKYFMAPNHWQIINHEASSPRGKYGTSSILPVEEVPAKGLRLALKATRLIGDGFYGVDLKQVGSRWVVIEVNDNPNVEQGVEDRYLKEELYRRLMGFFLRRIAARKEGRLAP